MSSRFYFGGSDSGSDSGIRRNGDGDADSDADSDTLPYPEPLARAAFLTTDFSPPAFLSSLANRHQTLEDLRSELRTRSAELRTELLDLVNANHTDFLRLGSSLHGGDEKVEEVRVGLLSFRREVEGLREKVTARRAAVEELLVQKRRVAVEMRTARGLLEVDERLGELERVLAIERRKEVGNEGKEETEKGKGGGKDENGSVGSGESEEEEDDEEEDSEDEEGERDMRLTVPLQRLQQRTHKFVGVTRLVDTLGAMGQEPHPFVRRQEERLRVVRDTLLLDLKTALKETRRRGDTQAVQLKILALYQIMEEPVEAIKAVKESTS